MDIATAFLFNFLRQQRLEGAGLATGRAQPAEMFSHHYQLRMIVLPVIEPGHTGFLIQRRFAKQFQFVVAGQ
jgi:hypothetical protein